MSEFRIESLYDEFENNVIKYLCLLKSEFSEVNELINALKSISPYKLDVRESTQKQNALNISVVVSYARNFKRSFGFEITSKINNHLIKNFTRNEKSFHKKIVKLRDTEFAHSDATPNDIIIVKDEFFGYSRRVVRQILEMNELDMLQSMVTKIRASIEENLQKLTKID